MRKARFVLAALALAQGGCSTFGVYEPSPDREGIREVVRSRLRDLEPCYERAIDARPGVEGKVVMEWEIGDNGKATGIRVKQADPHLEPASDCAKETIGTWQFPKPASDEVVTVTYPFVFSERFKR